jgi:hypothetical protein
MQLSSCAKDGEKLQDVLFSEARTTDQVGQIRTKVSQKSHQGSAVFGFRLIVACREVGVDACEIRIRAATP